MPKPLYRYLKGYTIDPGFSTQLDTMGINETTYRIRWEYLKPGPVGEYLEVIDYDPTTIYFYDPVDLDNIDIVSQHGLPPYEGSAQFHQQFVYVIIMQTIERFEKALGRRIIWQRRKFKKKKDAVPEYIYIDRLRVYPHAFRDPNAFYSEEKLALLFGYFDAVSTTQGSNFPGGVVFTCLSPDIIAHETTHAILDSIFPKYLENSNPDVPAFHEGFADIVALLQRFGNTQLVEHQMYKTRGRLDEYSVLGELATQFGEALASKRGALRSAIGQFNEKNEWEKIKADANRYQIEFEPHQRGAILVAAVFDAFMRLYNFRTHDLIRISTKGTGVLPQGNIHPDLVKRLAKEASEIALYLLSICIRALDYCPPFDITFGDYLRALITADVDLCPADENGYRVALIESFRSWGIFPEKVLTLSVYSLKWKEPELTGKETVALDLLSEYVREKMTPLLRITDRKKGFEEFKKLEKAVERLLNDPEKAEPKRWKLSGLTLKTWKSFLTELGLMPDPFVIKRKAIYGSSENQEVLAFDHTTKLDVNSVRPAFRIGSDDRQLEQVVLNISQTIKGARRTPFEKISFSGGCTIVICLSSNYIVPDYIIIKNINSIKRMKQQVNYQLGRTGKLHLSDSLFDTDDLTNTISFKHLHFH